MIGLARRVVRAFRTLPRKISRIVAWLPVLWRDEDWDWHFISVIIRFKLQRVAKQIEHNDVLAYVEQLAMRKQIDVVCKLLERAEADQYWEFLEPELAAILEHADGLVIDNIYKSPFTPQESLRSALASMTASRMQQRDIERALKIMARYLSSWWD